MKKRQILAVRNEGNAMKVEQWEEMQAAYGTADGFTDKSVTGMWFTFDGRLNRMRYFLRVLPVYLLMGAVTAISQHVWWLCVAYLPILWSLFSLVSRRAHDLGHRPWPFWIAVCLPLVNLFAGLYLLLRHGEHGPNPYGLDPTEYPYDI